MTLVELLLTLILINIKQNMAISTGLSHSTHFCTKSNAIIAYRTLMVVLAEIAKKICSILSATSSLDKDPSRVMK